MTFRELTKVFKRPIGIAISILALLLIATGCQPKLTPTETYDRIQQNSLNNKFTHVNYSGKMSMILDDKAKEAVAQDPNAENLLNMFKNIEFKGNVHFEQTEKIGKMAMNYDINLNGLSMTFDLFFDDEKLVMKYPLLPQYLVLNMDEAIGAINENSDLNLSYEGLLADYQAIVKEWYPSYLQTLSKNIADTNLVMLDTYEFTMDGKTYTSKAIEVKYDLNLINRSNEALLKSISESEALYQIVKKYNTTNIFESFEAYQKNILDSVSALNISPDEPELARLIEKMSMSYVMGYDRDYKLTFIDSKLQMPMEDPNLGSVDLSITMQGTFSYEDLALVMPEITADNQLNIIDYIKQNVPDLLGANFGASSDDYIEEEPLSDATQREIDLFLLSLDLRDAYSDENGIDIALQSYIMDKADVAAVYFARQDKKMFMLPDTTLPSDYDPRTRPFYANALLSEDYYLSEPYEDVTNGRMLQTISKAIVSEAGDVLGVVGIDYYIE